MFTKRAGLARNSLFDRFGNDELVERYKRNYGLGEGITLENVQRHATLEGELTDELLASTPDFEWRRSRARIPGSTASFRG